MGIIYDRNATENELYTAYGLTVYGTINRYEWTIYNGKEEDCITSLRIVDSDGKNLLNLSLGNNCIFMENFNHTIDNFLYWIVRENPDGYMIEKQTYKSLCQTDGCFNNIMRNRKFKEHQRAETRKKIEEREAKKQAALDRIKEYCRKKGFIFYYTGDTVYVLKALNEKAKQLVLEALNTEKMNGYIRFACEYPKNLDLRVIQMGDIEDIYID